MRTKKTISVLVPLVFFTSLIAQIPSGNRVATPPRQAPTPKDQGAAMLLRTGPRPEDLGCDQIRIVQQRGTEIYSVMLFDTTFRGLPRPPRTSVTLEAGKSTLIETADKQPFTMAGPMMLDLAMTPVKPGRGQFGDNVYSVEVGPNLLVAPLFTDGAYRNNYREQKLGAWPNALQQFSIRHLPCSSTTLVAKIYLDDKLVAESDGKLASSRTGYSTPQNVVAGEPHTYKGVCTTPTGDNPPGVQARWNIPATDDADTEAARRFENQTLLVGDYVPKPEIGFVKPPDFDPDWGPARNQKTVRAFAWGHGPLGDLSFACADDKKTAAVAKADITVTGPEAYIVPYIDEIRVYPYTVEDYPDAMKVGLQAEQPSFWKVRKPAGKTGVQLDACVTGNSSNRSAAANTFFWIQVINHDDFIRLDKTGPSDFQFTMGLDANKPPHVIYMPGLVLYDSPTYGIWEPSEVERFTRDFEATSTLMWKSTGNKNAIPVPVASLTWGWTIDAIPAHGTTGKPGEWTISNQSRWKGDSRNTEVSAQPASFPEWSQAVEAQVGQEMNPNAITQRPGSCTVPTKVATPAR